ncbi:methyl-accepting chemotaxis protein [Vibrio sp. 99-70-13A1]|uniref:methyl-accepting chemotaxis protein n=1 Tax=Vibrio sp. 99-70-13A1 TaxID=2607601 RepID=UPI001493ABA4|nr:methyl-accepting chemotaxis protein [Vibrio sp. 99-70-13A1]NOH98835.1 chemotaxis protein [Vibrio sp. 99-70-13A1]
MKLILRRFPLYLVVTFIAGVPLLISLILASLSVIDYREQAYTSNQDQEAVQLVALYDNLAHNIAVERGLSAGVLGSKGNPTQVSNLNKQRKIADKHINALLQFTPEYLSQELTQKLGKDIQQRLRSISDLRSQVDSLKPKSSPFAYYSDINQLAIDNSAMLLANISNSEITTLGASLISIVTMKEKAGQVRGALNGVFARGNATPALFANIQGYIAQGGYAMRSAIIEMPPKYATQLNGLTQQDSWKKVENIQNSFLSQSNNLEAIKGPEASAWFSLATDRIKLLNGLRSGLQENMISTSNNSAKQANFLSQLLVVLILTVGSLLLLSIVLCVQNLKKRVEFLTSNLDQMSKQRDLTVQLNMEGKDEISQISSSIDALTKNIKVLLSDVTKTNEHSTIRLDTIVNNSHNLDSSSQATTAKCANIATAMTELSQSSLEIAASAERALSETSDMQGQVTDCLNQSEASFASVEGLLAQITETQSCMTELEKDTHSIGQIVASIQGISEQTNLLALNAAIEAARAGEHGRGFAVVSSEVRDLAQRSKDATQNISQLLEKITENTRRSVNNMDKSREASDGTHQSVHVVNASVQQLGVVIGQLSEHITSIANSTIEQSKASEEVDKDIDTLSEIAQNTGALANDLNTIVDDYKVEVAGVQHKLSEFKLSL